MAYPNRGQIRAQFWYELDDPTGQIFTDTVPPGGTISLFQQALTSAYNALYSACLNYEIPRITDVLQGIPVPPGTTSLTPAQMGITSFGQYEWLAERVFGSQNRFCDLISLDRLPQRNPGQFLKEFVWRNDTFYFVGATNYLELQIEYETSGVPPTSNTATVLMDSCGDFLAWFAAGVAGKWKGYDELADNCMLRAVGPNYKTNGGIGGELYRLIQTKVRQRQKVPITRKPFTANRRLTSRLAIPYVQAQQGTTGGGVQNVPIQFSTATGQIVGNIDGVNAVFWIPVGGVISMVVTRNGLIQTYNVDYISMNNQITFIGTNIPQPGDNITVDAVINYNAYVSAGGWNYGPYGGPPGYGGVGG